MSNLLRNPAGAPSSTGGQFSGRARRSATSFLDEAWRDDAVFKLTEHNAMGMVLSDSDGWGYDSLISHLRDEDEIPDGVVIAEEYEDYDANMIANELEEQQILFNQLNRDLAAGRAYAGGDNFTYLLKQQEIVDEYAAGTIFADQNGKSFKQIMDAIDRDGEYPAGVEVGEMFEDYDTNSIRNLMIEKRYIYNDYVQSAVLAFDGKATTLQ